MANTLWLKNNTGSDVSLSDLGVKVPANGSVEVYKYNPYLTSEQIKKSKESGSLFKRLSSEILSITRKPKSKKPHTLGHLKSSLSPVEVVKSKTSVFVNTKEVDVLEDDDLGDIADYGLGDLGHKNTKNIVTKDGSIVVEQLEDEVEVVESDTKPSLEVSNVSGQSVVAMTNTTKAQTNPVGPIADNTSSDESFVVVKPQVEATAIQDVETKLSKISKVGNMVVAEGKYASDRNLQVTAKLNKLAEKNGVRVDELPENLANGIISDSVTEGINPTLDSANPKYDTQVATKDESGAIIMRLKEVPKSSTEEVAAKPVKVTKKKTTKKAKKKVSKKKTSKKKSSKKTS